MIEDPRGEAHGVTSMNREIPTNLFHRKPWNKNCSDQTYLICGGCRLVGKSTIMKKIFRILTLVFALSTVGYISHAQTQTKTVNKTKKGWSNKAKGAAIGGGAGAVTGAVVSHNKAKGAIIGGAVGAGAGYLVGRHKDKKNPNSRKVIHKTKTVSTR